MLFWECGGWQSSFCTILMIHWLATSPWSPIVAFRRMKTLIYSLVLAGVIVLGILFRVMLFGVFVIPSGSMERTIHPGDVVWVNKLIYGPQMPTSPYQIPWLGPLMWLIQGEQANMEKEWWSYRRLKGYGTPRVNDVVVFNQPNNLQVYIKRCMALPGDTFQIIDGEVHVNHGPVDFPDQAILASKVTFNNIDKIRSFIDSLSRATGNAYYPYWDTAFVSLVLSKQEIKQFKSLPEVDSVFLEPYRSNAQWGVYPWRKTLSWDLNNYGPMIIPRAGMEIPLNQQTFDLYELVIKNIDHNTIEQKGNLFFINGIRSYRYVFVNDCYFMMGDNRHDSEDSRYFGLVPGYRIIGCATGILFNTAGLKAGNPRIFNTLKPQSSQQHP
jgi:signal peptidase I